MKLSRLIFALVALLTVLSTGNAHGVYDASSGRWLTRDPFGPVDGPCLYAYARSSPVSLADPSGQLAGRTIPLGLKIMKVCQETPDTRAAWLMSGPAPGLNLAQGTTGWLVLEVVISMNPKRCDNTIAPPLKYHYWEAIRLNIGSLVPDLSGLYAASDASWAYPGGVFAGPLPKEEPDSWGTASSVAQIGWFPIGAVIGVDDPAGPTWWVGSQDLRTMPARNNIARTTAPSWWAGPFGSRSHTMDWNCCCPTTNSILSVNATIGPGWPSGQNSVHWPSGPMAIGKTE